MGGHQRFDQTILYLFWKRKILLLSGISSPNPHQDGFSFLKRDFWYFINPFHSLDERYCEASDVHSPLVFLIYTYLEETDCASYTWKVTHNSHFVCNAPICLYEGHPFPQKKDLVRHLKTKECPTNLGTLVDYCCPVLGCRKALGDAFARKYNFVRCMYEESASGIFVSIQWNRDVAGW